MKKLYFKNRNHQIRKCLSGNNNKSKMLMRNQKLEMARKEYFSIRSSLPKANINSPANSGYVELIPPKNFSLYDNFKETLAFLMDLRGFTTISRSRYFGDRRVALHANFANIESIDAAGGLVLAAEVDRWTRMDDRPVRPDDHRWNSDTAAFFHNAGLFELLKMNPQTNATSPTHQSIIPLKYETGTIPEGSVVDRVRQKLEALCGQSIGPRTQVYDALSEAMTNVVDHAYPKDFKLWPWVPTYRWWIGGSWDSGNEVVTVQMYDQGVGIPRTLPRSRHWSEVLPIFGRIDRESSDAGMIEAAMDYGRTSTGKSGRGLGLRQMADWTIKKGSGSLKIMSGKGMVTLSNGGDIKRLRLPAEFRGTLVEWEVYLNA